MKFEQTGMAVAADCAEPAPLFAISIFQPEGRGTREPLALRAAQNQELAQLGSALDGRTNLSHIKASCFSRRLIFKNSFLHKTPQGIPAFLRSLVNQGFALWLDVSCMPILSFKFRIEPNKTQSAALDFCLLYNACLEQRIEAWRWSSVSVCYNMQVAELKAVAVPRRTSRGGPAEPET